MSDLDDALRAALKDAHEMVKMRREEYRMLVDVLKEHWARIEQLEGALEWYARNATVHDGGERARAALRHGKEQKP